MEQSQRSQGAETYKNQNKFESEYILDFGMHQSINSELNTYPEKLIVAMKKTRNQFLSIIIGPKDELELSIMVEMNRVITTVLAR